MPVRNRALDGPQLGIAFDPDAGDDDRLLERHESPKQDVLVFATREHQDDRASRRITESAPGDRQIMLGRWCVDACNVDSIHHDSETRGGIPPAPQPARHRLAYRDRAIGRKTYGHELRRRGQRHRVTRYDEGPAQAISPAQPGERPAVTRPMAVHHIDLLARHQGVQFASEGSDAPEVDRHIREPRRARHAREHAAGPTSHEDSMTPPGELPAQARDYHRRPGAVPFVSELQDGEWPVSHGPKVPTSWPPFH